MKRTCVLLLALVLSACESDPRVPYISARLEGWPQPYRGRAGLKIWAFRAGTLEVPEALLFHGGALLSRRTIDNAVYLVRHPAEGWILFDSGLDTALAEEPAGPALEILFRPRVRESLAPALEEIGVKPDAVSHVLLSDLHFDRAGGLDVVPAARVVVSHGERRRAERGGLGYLPEEWEAVETWELVEFPGDQPLGPFPSHVDLLGDGSILLVPVPGHSRGGLAAVVMAESRPVFLAGELVPVAETLRYASRPRLLEDAAAWMDSFWRLKKLMQLVPELLVLAGHDLGPARKAEMPELTVLESKVAPTPTPTIAPAPPWMR